VIKLTVLYQKPSDTEKFDKHYFGTHMPLAQKMPGLVRADVTRPGPGLDGSEPPYYLQTELVFESTDALMKCFGTPEGQAVGADMANFESEGMIMMVGEIVHAWPQ
jgi:uncharacterized protein (TIGR02118 family)